MLAGAASLTPEGCAASVFGSLVTGCGVLPAMGAGTCPAPGAGCRGVGSALPNAKFASTLSIWSAAIARDLQVTHATTLCGRDRPAHAMMAQASMHACRTRSMPHAGCARMLMLMLTHALPAALPVQQARGQHHQLCALQARHVVHVHRGAAHQAVARKGHLHTCTSPPIAVALFRHAWARINIAGAWLGLQPDHHLAHLALDAMLCDAMTQHGWAILPAAG